MFQSLLNIQEHSIYFPALHELTISLYQVFCALNFTVHVLYNTHLKNSVIKIVSSYSIAAYIISILEEFSTPQVHKRVIPHSLPLHSISISWMH